MAVPRGGEAHEEDVVGRDRRKAAGAAAGRTGAGTAAAGRAATGRAPPTAPAPFAGGTNGKRRATNLSAKNGASARSLRPSSAAASRPERVCGGSGGPARTCWSRAITANGSAKSSSGRSNSAASAFRTSANDCSRGAFCRTVNRGGRSGGAPPRRPDRRRTPA
jgi:hypothetical protein